MKQVNLEKIKEKMELKKVTQQELAIALGYKDASTVHKLLKGEYQFRAVHVPVLMEMLDLTLKDLFFDNDFAKLAKDEQAATCA